MESCWDWEDAVLHQKKKKESSFQRQVFKLISEGVCADLALPPLTCERAVSRTLPVPIPAPFPSAFLVFEASRLAA